MVLEGPSGMKCKGAPARAYGNKSELKALLSKNLFVHFQLT